MYSPVWRVRVTERPELTQTAPGKLSDKLSKAAHARASFSEPGSSGRTALTRTEHLVANENERDVGLWVMADLATPMAIRVAATLRIADHITRGLVTAPALAEAANANTDELDRVLRHLANEGLLNRDKSGLYSLTARGEALRDD